MAINKNHQHLYDILDSFIDTCLIKDDSILDTSIGIFNLDNINTCITLFVDDFKDGKRNYQEKINEQFSSASDEVKLVFAHANWLWSFSVNDMTQKGKMNSVQICMPEKNIPNDYNNVPLFPKEGFGSAGSYHKQNKYWEIVANLKLLKWIKSDNSLTTKEAIKDKIVEICLFAKYDETETPTSDWQIDIRKIENSCAMFNILLYLSKPDKYERIASDNHKRKIFESFNPLILDIIKEDSLSNIDEQLLAIRQKISKYIPRFDYYENNILDLWNPNLSDSDYNEMQGLSFKKNIILYGPPGTGKTYTAKALAKSFICQEIIKKDPTRVKDYIEGKIDVEKYIKKLQLHSNYSYEDFIAGIQLKNGNTIPTKGDFLKLCEEIAAKGDDIPYVLILDEINRIDLSRLFGEAFSAIENRDEVVDLIIGDFKLKVPDNLFIIGTMNEIDFSLERLDFALRRRFIWFFYGFNADTLRVMLSNKLKGFNKVPQNDIESFIENAERLNIKISKIDELGKKYQIGHTFFSEIADIAKQYYGRDHYIQKVSLFKEKGPAETLWNISIEPILEAFFGNFDEIQKQEHLEEMRKLFLNEKK